MCTIHANSASDALYRLETLSLMSAGNVVLAAVRDQVKSALDLVVQLARAESGRRQVSEVGILPAATHGPGPEIACIWPQQGEGVPVFRHLQDRVARRGSANGGPALLGAARELISGGGSVA